MDRKVEIPLSKTKLFMLLMGALIFVTLGLYFILKPGVFVTNMFRSQEFIRMTGIGAVLFFGICSFFLFKKLFDNQMGLMIDENGVHDHSGATSVGLIEWPDITGLETVQIAATKILMIGVKNPEKYIERGKNGIVRKALKSNHKMYGSPISITSNALKINYDDLVDLVSEALNERK